VATITILVDEQFTYLYFNYAHRTHSVTIIGTTVIPEFPALLGPALLLAVLTLALLAGRTFHAPRRT